MKKLTCTLKKQTTAMILIVNYKINKYINKYINNDNNNKNFLFTYLLNPPDTNFQ